MAILSSIKLVAVIVGAFNRIMDWLKADRYIKMGGLLQNQRRRVAEDKQRKKSRKAESDIDDMTDTELDNEIKYED